MTLESFLYHLHYDTEKVKPSDMEVDWEDAPLPYKLYRGQPVVPLSAQVPLTLEGEGVAAKPDLHGVGDLLWYVYGLAQISEPLSTIYSYRRFVPSGGALYPSEIYVYLKVEAVPFGVYHYDAAHHRLVLLRAGNFDDYLGRALGNRCDLSASFCTVFVSTMFWKNFFKYHNFAYRLQALDAGVLIAELLEVAKRFGYASGVVFQFLDQAINHLLGLCDQEETVYAAILLSQKPDSDWFAEGIDGAGIADTTAAELCRELEEIRPDTYIRSQRVGKYPLLIKMNEASKLESTEAFRLVKVNGEKKASGDKKAFDWDGMVPLPPVNRPGYDLAAVCRKRYSPDLDFVWGQVSLEQLAVLLQEVMASFPYRNDLDGTSDTAEPRLDLYGCFYQVEGIADGAYRYDSAAHNLQRVRFGDCRHTLQKGMLLDNVSLYQVPLCLHVVGKREHLTKELGYRGYRIQQMEAGMLVQRIVLAATAMRMGGHPLLGFDANMCDELYKLSPFAKTSLIQIPVGPHRQRSRLEGGLHS